LGTADVPEQFDSLYLSASHAEALQRSPAAAAAAAAGGAHHYSTEDAEVAKITLSGGRQQQGLSLLHHLEAILGHQQQRSSCRSTPPVLPGGTSSNSSSKCCTPTPGRRSCSALELAAMAEGYLQSPLSPSAAAAAAAQSPATWHPSTVAVNSSINNRHHQQLQQQQQGQQVQHASDATTPQPAHSGASAVQLPPRVQISSKDMKQRLLVEPPSSTQLLPHTQSRSATLLSAVHDSAGMLDLEPETPKLLSPAAQAGSSHIGQGCVVPASKGVPASPGAARLAAVRSHETCTTAAAARGANSEGWSADTAAAAEADMHSRSPLVLVLPPAVNQPSSHGTERWRVAVDEPSVTAARPGSTQSNLASPASAGTGNDSGRQLYDGKGRLRGTHAADSVDSGAEGVSCKLQQQRSRSSSVASSRSRQGRRGACRSLSRGPAAAAGARNCSSSLDMHGNTTSAAPVGGDAGSSLGIEGGVRRSSGGGCSRAREPAGPLELDPCAPPLGSIQLSQPDLADVDYIVHRWSHRWVNACF
jgi:hypothetical protein